MLVKITWLLLIGRGEECEVLISCEFIIPCSIKERVKAARTRVGARAMIRRARVVWRLVAISVFSWTDLDA